MYINSLQSASEMIRGCSSRHYAYITLLIVSWLIKDVYPNSWMNDEGYMEYCETEIFKAECPAGHMIYMRSAKYGRMKFGRCVDRDYGYIGCAHDVLELADNWCSGRPSCQIPVPNSAFKSTRPCPKDLKPYFEASYGCLPVQTASNQACESSSFVLPSSSTGYIANAITMESQKGSADCPWMIQARPGQRVNITLVDFARSSAHESNSVSGDYDICHVYAVVRERSKTRGVTICGGKERERHVYTSIGNSVEIRILGGKLQGHDTEYFMLQYEVSGCQDPMTPEHTWMKRDVDSALIGCPETGQTWRLYCVANQWEGEVGNCTGDAGSPTIGEMIWSTVFIPFEVSLVIVVLIAVGIGIVVLAIGLICMKGYWPEWCWCNQWSKKQKAAKANKPVQPVSPSIRPNKSNDPHGLPPPPEFMMNENEGVVMENEYAYIDELPPPPPSPSPPPPAPPLSAPPYPIATQSSSTSPTCHKATSRDRLMMSHDQLHMRGDTLSVTSVSGWSPRHQGNNAATSSASASAPSTAAATAFPFPPPLPADVLANPSFVPSPAHQPNPSPYHCHTRHNSMHDAGQLCGSGGEDGSQNNSPARGLGGGERGVGTGLIDFGEMNLFNTTGRYGAIRVKEVAPYSIRTCHGLQHPDASSSITSVNFSPQAPPRSASRAPHKSLPQTPQRTTSIANNHTGSPFKLRENCRGGGGGGGGDTISMTYSQVPSYFELEADAPMPRDAVPYEYGYSCQTGEKFTVYHAKSLGKHFKGGNGSGSGGVGASVIVNGSGGKKKHKFILKKKKSKTGTM